MADGAGGDLEFKVIFIGDTAVGKVCAIYLFDYKFNQAINASKHF